MFKRTFELSDACDNMIYSSYPTQYKSIAIGWQAGGCTTQPYQELTEEERKKRSDELEKELIKTRHENNIKEIKEELSEPLKSSELSHNELNKIEKESLEEVNRICYTNLDDIKDTEKFKLDKEYVKKILSKSFSSYKSDLFFIILNFSILFSILVYLGV